MSPLKAHVAIVKCETYDPQAVGEAIERLLKAAGGIEAFIRVGSSVFVKPNMLMAIEPEAAITTHPEVVRAVVRLLKGIGCTVAIGDGPSVWGAQAVNLPKVWERTGIKKVAEEEGVALVPFDAWRWRGTFPLAAVIDRYDHLVSLPKMKTHELTLLTGCVKNLFGLVSDVYKTELHRRHFDSDAFSKILVDVYDEVRPSLTVVDGILALEGDGPATGGKVRHVGVLLAGKDCIALDSVMSAMMGIAPMDVPTTREAARRGVGVADLGSIRVSGASLGEVTTTPFTLPRASIKKKIPRPILNLGRALIRFLPKIDHRKCTYCGACAYVCPPKVITVTESRIQIDYRRCISCFCCQESCPSAAIRVKKSLLARMVGL